MRFVFPPPDWREHQQGAVSAMRAFRGALRVLSRRRGLLTVTLHRHGRLLLRSNRRSTQKRRTRCARVACTCDTGSPARRDAGRPCLACSVASPWRQAKVTARQKAKPVLIFLLLRRRPMADFVFCRSQRHRAVTGPSASSKESSCPSSRQRTHVSHCVPFVHTLFLTISC